MAARVCYRPDTVAFTTTRLRWYIGGLLFLSTVINYVDRQTLSVLAPYLKIEYTWTNTDFAWIIIAFRVAYSIGQTRGRQVAGSRRHADGPVARGALVLRRRDADVARGRPEVVRRVPFPARRRRGGQLAGRDEGGLRVVPAARERLGGRAVRQRIVGRGGDRAGPRAVAVPRLRHVAPGVRHHRLARPDLAVLFRRALPPARDAIRGSPRKSGPTSWPTGSRLEAGRTGPRPPARCRRRACSGCARRGASSSARRSPIRCGSSSPTGSRSTWSPRLQARGRACSVLGAVPRRGRRQLPRRRHLQLPDRPRRRGRHRAQAGHRRRRPRHEQPDDQPAAARPRVAGGLLRGRHLLLRGAVDDGPEPAGGSLPSARGGVGERLQRNRRRPGHDRRHPRHRRRHRPLLLRARSWSSPASCRSSRWSRC